MSPNSSKTPRASAEETHAARESARVPEEDTSANRSNRDSLQLMSTRENSPAKAIEGSHNESSEQQTGLRRRHLPKHDPIYIVFGEFKHDHDVPIHDPTRVQELAIEIPKTSDPKSKFMRVYN